MKLTQSEKAAYGIGAVGKDMVYSLVAGFLMYYYNTVLGISASFIGVLFMAARVFDAFNDPIMGIIVEKTKTPLGKFRPWLIIGTVLNAIVLIAMFNLPVGLEGNRLLIVSSVAYVLWGVTYTMMDIPYWSMIPAITESGKEREQVSVIARSCAGVGFAVPVALTMALVPLLGSGDERQGFGYLAMIVAALFIAFVGVTVWKVKNQQSSNQTSPTIKMLFDALLKNDQAQVVVVAIVIFNASLYITQQLAIYFFKYDIGNPALFGVFGTVGGAAQILAMMLVPVFRKKLSLRQLLTAAIATTLLGYSILFVMGAMNLKNLLGLSLAAVVIFVGFGIATVLTTIFLADTVDYGQWKSGQRAESVVFSLQTFVVKLGSAISVLIAGVGLDLVGFKPLEATQSMGTLFGIRFMMIIIPMLGLMASLWFFLKRYKLDEATLAMINAANEEQKRLGEE